MLDLTPPKQECWYAVYKHNYERHRYFTGYMRFGTKESLLRASRASNYWSIAYLVHVKLK